jgi:hypothetical protein
MILNGINGGHIVSVRHHKVGGKNRSSPSGGDEAIDVLQLLNTRAGADRPRGIEVSKGLREVDINSVSRLQRKTQPRNSFVYSLVPVQKHSVCKTLQQARYLFAASIRLEVTEVTSD